MSLSAALRLDSGLGAKHADSGSGAKRASDLSDLLEPCRFVVCIMTVMQHGSKYSKGPMPHIACYVCTVMPAASHLNRDCFYGISESWPTNGNGQEHMMSLRVLVNILQSCVHRQRSL